MGKREPSAPSYTDVMNDFGAGILIRIGIRYPGIMENPLFMWAMRRFPARLSASYDRRIADTVPDYRTPLEQALVRLSQITEQPERILDLATGTGFAALRLSEYFPAAIVHAVDHAPEMVVETQAKAARQRRKNVIVSEENARHLSFKDESFDLVVTSNAPVYPGEAARVLRPEGTYLVLFSFGGSAFDKHRDRIETMLHRDGFDLVEIVRSGGGVGIIARRRPLGFIG
jgi:SAM-dependent methyltransferase